MKNSKTPQPGQKALSPILRIALGFIVCALAMLLSNSLLKIATNPQSDLIRVFRWVLTTGILLMTYTLLFRRLEKRAITELGKPGCLQEILSGFVLGVAAISLIILLFHLLGFYTIQSMNPVKTLILSLLFYITAAALEEVLFRGVLYRILEERWGLRIALLISALLFGLIHLPNAHANVLSVVSAASGGVLLGLLYSLTRRLWLPLAFHAAWNWTQAAWGTVVSGADDLPNFLQASLNGPTLLTGGRFGPENSLLAIFLIWILCGLAYRRLMRKKP